MVSAEFPFESKYLDVKHSRMHYVDEGKGQPFLFLHGNPTSSYLWRNIIPHVLPHGRAIAPDLIGMGKSDKPDIGYTFREHSDYIDEFIAKLGLTDIIFVIHDWGSALGFHYAHRNPDNVRGLAFMEAILRPVYSWKELSFLQRLLFKRLRHPEKGYKMIVRKNFFVEWILPMLVVRRLTKEEMDHYRAPFRDEGSRKPIFIWPNEIPIEGEPKENTEIVQSYYDWLKKTELPKLLLWGKPGAIIKERQVAGIAKELPAVTTKYVGRGKHYIQEDHPDAIGEAIVTWYQTI